ncbi:hypothetical protein G3I68_44130, partial [Streptomyces sp. SID13588]|nr:hypothetical protein [Streptomyces sp. SID13588]
MFLLLSTSVDSEHREELVGELARTADDLGDAGVVLTLERHVGPLDEQAALALLRRALAVAHPRLRAVGLRVLLEPLSGPLTDEVRDAALRCAAEARGSVRLFAVVALLGHA